MPPCLTSWSPEVLTDPDEANVVRSGLPYLQAVWWDRNWTLYAVTNPRPVIASPGRVIARRRFPNGFVARAGWVFSARSLVPVPVRF
jgi:hypothetical protein